MNSKILILIGILTLAWVLVLIGLKAKLMKKDFSQKRILIEKKTKEKEVKMEKELKEKEIKEEEVSKITLISVYDNYQISPELKTDWGFALVIETPKEKILFDTGGNSEILLFNMKKLGIDPKSISKIIISHAHHDHLGGLEGFLKENSKVEVFILDSFPEKVKEMVKSYGAQLIEISKPQKISDFVFSTGPLEGPPEEESLIILSNQGLIVITGCAHPGIVNIVKKAKEMFPQKEIYLVLGGFHFPPKRVVEEFKNLGVKKVAPSHCSGEEIREAFKEEYQENFIENGVGKIIEIK